MARNKNEKAPKGLITRETLISDIAANYIKPVEVMLTYGLHCIGCGASSFDTVETGAALHGMDDEMINKLVDDLNKAAAEEVKEREEREKAKGKKAGNEKHAHKEECGCADESGHAKTVEVTSAASKRLLEHMAKEGKKMWGIRLTATKNDLGNYDYELDFEKEPSKSDIWLMLEDGKTKIFFEKSIEERVKGIRIDYKKNTNGQDVFTMKIGDGCGCH